MFTTMKTNTNETANKARQILCHAITNSDHQYKTETFFHDNTKNNKKETQTKETKNKDMIALLQTNARTQTQDNKTKYYKQQKPYTKNAKEHTNTTTTTDRQENTKLTENINIQEQYKRKFKENKTTQKETKKTKETENTIENQHKQQHKQQQKPKEKETKNHTTTNHKTNRTKKNAKNNDIGTWVISEVFSMIIDPKRNNENIYIAKKQNENKDIGHVLTTYYAKRLKKRSLHKINQMQIIHKARMRTRKHKTISTLPSGY